MERDEFKVLVKGMKAVYSQETFIPDQDAFNMWFVLLQDIPYEVCRVAVQKHMMLNKFPPTVAEIRELAATAVNGRAMTWGESWEKARTAIRRYGSYNQTEALNSLDPVTRKCVESMGYKNLCFSENEMADRAHYQRLFEVFSKREQEDRQLSAPLLEAIHQFHLKGMDGEPLKIGEGGGE